MNVQRHWERDYETKAPDQVSWFRPHLETSLALIGRTAVDRPAAIIDVGGGASTLVDDLLGRGYRNITVLDISQIALDVAKERLGEASDSVQWLRCRCDASAPSGARVRCVARSSGVSLSDEARGAARLCSERRMGGQTRRPRHYQYLWPRGPHEVQRSGCNAL
jgi:hypothetical protein